MEGVTGEREKGEKHGVDKVGAGQQYLRSYFCHDYSSIYSVITVRCCSLAL